ncbi:MAG: hypothetical protein RBS57_04655, partial [Desulforhabdus sp.]|nr:hypothetical protein [Desulforhabdus sp.]
MAKPSRERVRKWREKKAKTGGRSLSTWLEPETVRMMDYLLDYYGETAAPLIARAISTLYQITCNNVREDMSAQPPFEAISPTVSIGAEPASGEGSPVFSEPGEKAERDLLPEYGAPGIDPLLSEIKEKIAQGEPIRILQKTLLVEWIKSMQRRSLSFQAMAECLNAAQIPTL